MTQNEQEKQTYHVCGLEEVRENPKKEQNYVLDTCDAL